jgi:hypothetical protein
MAPHAALSAWWRATGHAPAPAFQAEHSVRALESRYGVALPEDFRTYLTSAAPAEDFGDDHDVTWWSPGRVRNIPDEYEHPIGDPAIAREADACLFFADFLLWASAWAICCSEGANRGKVALIDGASDRFVAESFSRFVELYLKDPASVC